MAVSINQISEVAELWEDYRLFQERICVVIPMYRVAPYIQDVLRGLPAWIWRVVVVDDASPDQSMERVIEFGDPRVVTVSHPQNQGVGGAMLSGYNKAIEIGATILIKMDGDNQMSPDYLPALIKPILEGRADYVKGNRFVHVDVIKDMPLVRRFGNLALSFLNKAASGYWNIFDPTNGYTAMDGDIFRRVNQSRIHKRYFFESSLLMELNLLRAVIVDIPMPALYPHKSSSMAISRILYEFPVLLFYGLLRRIWFQYFVLDFSVASLFLLLGIGLILFGSLWGGQAWIHSNTYRIPATTGTVMIAVLPIILGFQLILQAIAHDIVNVPKTVVSDFASLRIKNKIASLLGRDSTF